MADPASYRPAPGSIPESPGVYRFRDERGRVVYVGKAKNLRSRLNSYFADFAGLHPRTQSMLRAAAQVDWTVVGTEVEALQLEYSWIKEFDPRFNVRYRDDKSYPYLAVLMDEEFPRVQVMRGAKRRGVRYFGPYSHAWAIRDTVDTLLRVFPVRTCSAGVFKRAGQIGRPCLLGYIDKCSAPCVGRINAAEHRALAEEFCDFMAGQTGRFIKRLEAQMREASAAEEYERAARLRDDIQALQRALEKQAVVLPDGTDCDVIALAEDQLEAAVQVFYVRGGRVRGQRGWVVDKVEDVSSDELVEHFLGQVYDSDPVAAGPPARTARAAGAGRRRRGQDGSAPRSAIPREVLVPALPPEAAAVEEWLGERRGSRVSLRVPQRGDKKALLDTVARNAAESLALHKTRRASDLTTRSVALNEIQEALGLDEAPLRIESYDVSNLQGTHVVASMVVFEDGLARKSEYRRFAIRGLDGTDDVAAIHEVITRRFRRYLEEQAAQASELAAGGAAGCRAGGPAQVRLPAEPAGHRWRSGAGSGRGAGAGRTRRRGRRGVRPGQAAGRGLAAGRGRTRHPAAQQRGPVPAAAGKGRGAPVRDHLSPGQAVGRADGQRTRCHSGPRPGPAGYAAAAVRLGAQAQLPRRRRRSPRCRASASARRRQSTGAARGRRAGRTGCWPGRGSGRFDGGGA